MTELPPNLRHRLILVREMERRGLDDREVRRRRDRGELVRVRRGCYVHREEWEAMGPRERHIARAHAVAANASIEPVFTHVTAAALHGIPLLGGLSGKVHVTIPPGTTRRNQPDLSIHALAVEREQLVRVDGLLVTSLPRALVEIALTTSFEHATVALDWGLAHGVDRSDLFATLELAGSSKRGRAAEAAIEFADGASGSPGESLSRGVMHLVGVAPPLLQAPIRDSRGLIGYADFFWREAGIVGEFDGVAKYVREEYLAGRSSAQVVVDEKVREDRMRATRLHVVRWGWPEANDPARLASLLREAGVPALH